ncbi:hypothetical protein FHR81_001704 [Actinoalloteichus hoggarensis]|uniref:Uncharacterized protein n=1 Tax=Actinoalloteichus hoggarensis TaxID=1470176 RepID=A0A221W507_9PSEU|nr:hypothetical protein AHOG_15550 [Actinoalloteichus hoggarensis]MBB5920666.1 hypothetical protein [Actinoalloteichus hoggarensis]
MRNRRAFAFVEAWSCLPYSGPEIGSSISEPGGVAEAAVEESSGETGHRPIRADAATVPRSTQTRSSTFSAVRSAIAR